MSGHVLAAFLVGVWFGAVVGVIVMALISVSREHPTVDRLVLRDDLRVFSEDPTELLRRLRELGS